MPETALLVVDVQTGMIHERTYQRELFMSSLITLIADARQHGMPVVYVRHNDEKGGGKLETGSDAWHIHHAIEPAAGETIVDKRFNSAFRQTNLREHLDSLGVTRIVLAGMMTEYCLDTTCKVAFEYGYAVLTSPEINTTTAKEPIPPETLHRYFNHAIWNKRFADVLPFAELQAFVRQSQY